MLANVFDITSCFRLSPPWGGRPKSAAKPAQKESHFNPRPPWGGRQVELAKICGKIISIHALRGEGDEFYDVAIDLASAFQSTPSVGRATCSLL